MARWLVCTLILLMGAPALAQGDGLGSRAETLIEETGSPGAAMARVDSSGFDEGVAGVRIAGSQAAIEPGDLWHMGSNTKAMTATLAARLVERGVISWDTSVEDALADMAIDIHPGLAPATLGDLLAHRSGIAANAGPLTAIRLAGTDEDRDPGADRRAYAAAVLSGEPAVAHGSFLYSNAGYVVAALMLEAATGQGYESLMDEEVFGPLGMDSAGWGPPGERGAADQPRGHRPGLLGGLAPREPGAAADNPVAMNSAGRAHMALEDLARFLDAHMRRDGDYLSPESWAKLHTPAGGGDYALGWGVGEDGMLIHAGSNTMWFVQMAVWPDAETSAVVAVNDGRIETVAGPVREALMALGPAGR